MTKANGCRTVKILLIFMITFNPFVQSFSHPASAEITPDGRPASHRPHHTKGRRKRRQRQPQELSSELAPIVEQLQQDLQKVSITDARAFQRRLAKARSEKALDAIAADISRAMQVVEKRSELIPPVYYPEQLPVAARKDDIAAAIKTNQVVIIAGETGSGKTTQIPKICLELGRGRRGFIGHTQPRRLAARTVAERIADELGQKIGESVGYAIRFDDQVGEHSSVKLMTDGILLAEMQRDRYLNAYDTIIIDEAHERSLNIDFLLGYLKQLLPKRPDLKIIITSATIDPERFAQHFADAQGNPAPIIEVSGRTYPVEVLYRPLQVERGDKLIDLDPVDGLLQAIKELMGYGDGDILCFFPGEADIREAMEAISAQRWKGVEVVPLFGRLSNQEQHRVFRPHSGRRIVLSTNIAETSLTVPGIHFVVDTGTARISRYSHRTKVQRLPIEPISQASANQRSGRCGRVTDGIAIRLYSEQDFAARPEFTDPEILRTNLASVILQMAALKLGNIEYFPFVQAPDVKAIRNGMLLLHELGAIEQKESSDGTPKLTAIGRTIARIPLDPRMARMLIEANQLGCLTDVQVIVAALTIQDVRERPLEFQAQADQLHARFKDKASDFMSLLKLWDYITDSRENNSGNSFRKLMQKEFLHYLRIREWLDLVRQLQSIGEELGWSKMDELAVDRLVPVAKRNVSATADGLATSKVSGYLPDHVDAIHQSLLSGLLSHIGIRQGETREYLGTRNMRFQIFPGSGLSKSMPSFVMAAELVETSKLWARQVASIDPRWVERLGSDLLKHHYSEPHWSKKQAAALVYQRSSLLGVPVVADRLALYHRIDPTAARDMFIRHALVDGEWNTHHKFFHNNAKKLAQATELEHKARRRGIVVETQTLFDFYDTRLPASVYSGQTFNHWWKTVGRDNPELLDFDPDKLTNEQADSVSDSDFPATWQQGDLSFELSYSFLPGSPDDGVTIKVPVPLLAGLREHGFDWLVPGMREELLTELIRGLPKPLRRSVVPAPDFARRVLPAINPKAAESLYEQLATALAKVGGQGINASDFRPTLLPDHLRMSFAAIDRSGKVVDRDRSLAALKQRQDRQIKSSMSKAGQHAEQPPVARWTPDTLGTVPEEVITEIDGQKIIAYPALVVTTAGVAIKVFGTKTEADAAMMTATLALLLKEIPVSTQKMLNGLPLRQRVAVENYPHGGATGLINDARITAIRDGLIACGGPVRDPKDFHRLSETIKPHISNAVRQMIVGLAPGLVDYYDVITELKNWTGTAITDMEQQVRDLLPPHALSVVGINRLKHLPRYMAAVKNRLVELPRNPDRDAERQAVIDRLKQQLTLKVQGLPSHRRKTKEVKEIQWLLEELRVSLFAQRLGTAIKVSEVKIAKAIAALQ